jgi:DNA polymerase
MKKDNHGHRSASQRLGGFDTNNALARGAEAFLSAHQDMHSLKEASLKCEGCGLYKYANHTVFGEGPANARVVFVGEQPGNSEDKQGRPFVGPAGRLLDKVLEELKISREVCYVTNTVKHFKYEWRGENRLHKTTPTDRSKCLFTLAES